MIRRQLPARAVSVAVVSLLAVAPVAGGILVAALWLPERTAPSVMATSSGPETLAVSSESYDGGRDVAASPQVT